MGTRVITVPIIQELNKLYDAGATMKELANKYNVSSVTIHNYVWKPRKTRGGRENARNINEATIKEINRLYVKGYNMLMVSKMVGVGNSSVCRYVLEARAQGTKTEIRV